MLADLHGVRASVVLQVNAADVEKLAAPEEYVPLKMLVIPAIADASAALWAIWRCAKRCAPSMPRPMAPMRKMLIASATMTTACPSSSLNRIAAASLKRDDSLARTAQRDTQRG